jgi:light-regulated signal transduction histidine kinase (bacteriophytochrome)
VSDIGEEISLADNPDFIANMYANLPDYTHVEDPNVNPSEKRHLEQYGGNSVLNIPIIMRGELIAIAEVWESRYHREFSPEEVSLLQGIAQQAGIAIEHARLFEELQIRAKELQRSNTDLQDFAYIASHDLQEPLRMIRSYIALLAKRYASVLDQDAQEFIDFAVDGAERMQELINGLLDFSRVETRGTVFGLVDSKEAVEAALKNLELVVQENAATIQVSELPMVYADRMQLIQLFQNLIGNAIKFRSDAPPKVVVDAEHDENGLVFRVSDNGIGIDERFHDRVFKIFQRLHTREQYPGAGIGLAISKRIVERHGGRIWVGPSENGGSVFSFCLEGEK